MFKKIIDWLYIRCGSKNIVACTRLQMLGTNQEFQVEELGEVDRKSLALDAVMVLQSPAYQTAVNNVKGRIMKHIQEDAPNANVIFYDRFTINGVKLIEEELASYAEMDVQAQEQYDRYKMI